MSQEDDGAHPTVRSAASRSPSSRRPSDDVVPVARSAFPRPLATWKTWSPPPRRPTRASASLATRRRIQFSRVGQPVAGRRRSPRPHLSARNGSDGARGSAGALASVSYRYGRWYRRSVEYAGVGGGASERALRKRLVFGGDGVVVFSWCHRWKRRLSSVLSRGSDSDRKRARGLFVASVGSVRLLIDKFD